MLHTKYYCSKHHGCSDYTHQIALISFHWSDLQTSKNCLRKGRGCCSELLLDWTGDMCESYHDKPVYVGFLSAQNEQVPEAGREGAGGCVLRVFLCTKRPTPSACRSVGSWWSRCILIISPGPHWILHAPLESAPLLCLT